MRAAIYHAFDTLTCDSDTSADGEILQLEKMKTDAAKT